MKKRGNKYEGKIIKRGRKEYEREENQKEGKFMRYRLYGF